MHLCKNVLSCTFKICVLTICKLHQKNSKKEREREKRKSSSWEVGRKRYTTLPQNQKIWKTILKALWSLSLMTSQILLHSFSASMFQTIKKARWSKYFLLININNRWKSHVQKDKSCWLLFGLGYMVRHKICFPWVNTTRFSDFRRLENVGLTRLYKAGLNQI